jgi:Na+-driven multidrug efflux pump
VAYLWAYLTRSPKYPAGSPDALFFSLLISWVTGAVLNYLWYRRGTWREKSLIKYGAVSE